MMMKKENGNKTKEKTFEYNICRHAMKLRAIKTLTCTRDDEMMMKCRNKLNENRLNSEIEFDRHL